MNKFKVAAGTVAGTKHLLTGERNQDSVIYFQSENFMCGVVADGMSVPGTASEVGSVIAARVLNSLLSTNGDFLEENSREEFLILVKRNLIQILFKSALGLCEPKALERVLYNFFNFTLTCFIMTKEELTIFSFGDGFYKLNDKEVHTDLTGTEEPKYVINAGKIDTPYYNFKIKEVIATKEVDKLLISSCGILSLEKTTDMKYNDLFDDSYFESGGNLSSKLYELQRENHVFPDDVGVLLVKAVNGERSSK